MSNQLTGIIKQINDTASYGAKNFTKREFVVDILDGKFTQPIKLELVKENCSKIDKFREGQKVTVDYNLRGNEHGGKYYVSLVAWNIKSDENQKQDLGIDPPPWPSKPQRQESPARQVQSAQVPVGGEGDETYPF